jgi:4-amino-4-deoxy-L-arabinose transferase-like glycosyltransferase
MNLKFFPWLALALGAFAYLYNLGSDHAATNPDEHLYLQITRMTADGGEWLPLKNLLPKERNTKPPALFWQGIVATDWGRHWELWRVRLPVAAYTLATALIVLLLARRLSGSTATGVLAALAFLAFFSTYRYGRVALTSAPETFWFFLPFTILLWRGPRPGDPPWPLALAFGLMVGIGLLYKSFALVIPFCAGLAWWTLHTRGYKIAPWLRGDFLKIGALGTIAVGVFCLWFAFDPDPASIWRDFVVKENVGKFDPKGGSYIANFFFGSHSVWRILLGYPFNAGLLALAAGAFFVIAFRQRKDLSPAEKLLWIWILTNLIVFTFPDARRDERYLLPAMPAVAVLMALRWQSIPRWTLAIPLAVVAAASLVFIAGMFVLENELGASALYPWYAVPFLAGTAAFAIAGLKSNWTRSAICPAVFLLYLGYAVFLKPFDGPLGEYSASAVEAVRGKTVMLPSVYGAHDEVYRFMLPGADVKLVKAKTLKEPAQFSIQSIPARDAKNPPAPGTRILGTRLNLNDRFTREETREILRGDLTGQLFRVDLLVEVPASTTP